MSPARKLSLIRFLGFPHGMLPFNYLGVPIFQGNPRTTYLQPIIDRNANKLSSWKGHLPHLWRVQLVKSIIHGMVIYNFHVSKWSIIGLLMSLDRCIRNFIWSVERWLLLLGSWCVLGCLGWSQY